MADDRIAVVIRFEKDLFDAIEKYRGVQSPIPPRTDTIKDLVRSGLACMEKHQPAPPRPDADGDGAR